ncbi:MAG: hypothetical protein KC492_45360, partial [Myxococcales bacterium]|nr:hypothetical protein [Myxococcales bacterium]
MRNLHRLQLLPFAVSLLLGCSTTPEPRAPVDASKTTEANPEFDPAPACAVPPPKDVSEMAAATNAFGFDLYRQLPEGDDNLAISPASIGITLNMLRVGARDATARQLEQAL